MHLPKTKLASAFDLLFWQWLHQLPVAIPLSPSPAVHNQQPPPDPGVCVPLPCHRSRVGPLPFTWITATAFSIGFLSLVLSGTLPFPGFSPLIMQIPCYKHSDDDALLLRQWLNSLISCPGSAWTDSCSSSQIHLWTTHRHADLLIVLTKFTLSPGFSHTLFSLWVTSPHCFLHLQPSSLKKAHSHLVYEYVFIHIKCIRGNVTSPSSLPNSRIWITGSLWRACPSPFVFLLPPEASKSKGAVFLTCCASRFHGPEHSNSLLNICQIQRKK